jgi:ferredoxin
MRSGGSCRGSCRTGSCHMRLKEGGGRPRQKVCREAGAALQRDLKRRATARNLGVARRFRSRGRVEPSRA